jgi:hypothetical protein
LLTFLLVLDSGIALVPSRGIVIVIVRNTRLVLAERIVRIARIAR